MRINYQEIHLYTYSDIITWNEGSEHFKLLFKQKSLQLLAGDIKQNYHLI